MPKGLSGDAQQMVASLLEYFQREKDNGGPLLPLNSIGKRVAAALNISIATVWRISAKSTEGEELNGPRTSKEKKKPIVDIEESQESEIRNCIYDMYKNKEHITLKTLNDKLAQRFLFNGCLSSLWKVLKNIGFRFRKDDPRRGMMELPNIAMKRIKFLQQYIQFKNEGLRQFVFLDETWIFQNGTIGHSWQDSSVKSVKKNKVGGSRNKPAPIYKADLIAEKYGHQVLRLPPYHCIFNPIELIWGITKNYYRDHLDPTGSSDIDSDSDSEVE